MKATKDEKSTSDNLQNYKISVIAILLITMLILLLVNL